MTVTVNVNINNAAVRANNARVSRAAIMRAARTTQQRAKANVAAAGRVKTGRMMEMILVQQPRTDANGSTVVDVTCEVFYAIFQEAGTSRGITPAWFMRNALASLRESDFA